MKKISSTVVCERNAHPNPISRVWGHRCHQTVYTCMGIRIGPKTGTLIGSRWVLISQTPMATHQASSTYSSLLTGASGPGPGFRGRLWESLGPKPNSNAVTRGFKKPHGMASALVYRAEHRCKSRGPRPGPFPSPAWAGLSREAAEHRRSPALDPRKQKPKNPLDCIGD